MELVFVLVAMFCVLGPLFYAVTLYNGLISARADIDKAWSNIDVLLKQRYDEITRLVEVCKGYMQYERETLQAVTEARSRFVDAVTVAQKADASGGMTAPVQRLLVAAEKYPELKASENFLALQKRITELENQIADRREFYNDAVNHFNVRIQEMPDAMIAQTMKLQARSMFHARGAERVAPELAMAGARREGAQVRP
ncbi:MAG TPA: LemA family protein [Candidatus Dormibacteraeota bacterium]|nr:LemA family protein [Candidatus Dormibacteraeota bacterium]